MVGSVASSNTMEAAIVCKNAGIPLLTPASTNDRLTEDVEDLRRRGVPRLLQGLRPGQRPREVRGRHAEGQEDRRRRRRGSGLRARARGQLREGVHPARGGVVEREYYSQKDLEYKTLVQKVADRKPDVVLVAGYYPQAGPMIRVAKDAWKDIPVIGGDGLDSPEFLSHLKGVGMRVYLSTHFDSHDKDPLVSEFVRKYIDRVHKRPGAMAGVGYDAMLAVHEAAARSKAAHPDAPYDPKNLTAALRGLEFTGVTGHIKIGDDRTPHKTLVIVQVKDDDFGSWSGSNRTSPRAARPLLQHLVNGLSQGAIYALIALGYTMVYGIVRLINFAHGEFFMVGAFAGYFVLRDAGLDRLDLPRALADCGGLPRRDRGGRGGERRPRGARRALLLPAHPQGRPDRGAPHGGRPLPLPAEPGAAGPRHRRDSAHVADAGRLLARERRPRPRGRRRHPAGPRPGDRAGAARPRVRGDLAPRHEDAHGPRDAGRLGGPARGAADGGGRRPRHRGHVPPGGRSRGSEG